MHLIPLDKVDNVWPRVVGWIDKAIRKAKSNRTVMDTYAAVRNGSMFMAVNTTSDEPASLDDVRGVMLMSFYEVEGRRTCQYVFVAGEGDTEEWFGEALVWPWFTTMGVQQFVCEGRYGWVKRLEQTIPNLKMIRAVFSWEHDSVGAH